MPAVLLLCPSSYHVLWLGTAVVLRGVGCAPPSALPNPALCYCSPLRARKVPKRWGVGLDKVAPGEHITHYSIVRICRSHATMSWNPYMDDMTSLASPPIFCT